MNVKKYSEHDRHQSILRKSKVIHRNRMYESSMKFTNSPPNSPTKFTPKVTLVNNLSSMSNNNRNKWPDMSLMINRDILIIRHNELNSSYV